MFKYVVAIFAVMVITSTVAEPSLLGALRFTAPAAVVAAPAPVITATSSQVVARNFNGLAAAPVVAPFATPLIARYAAPLAYSSPLAYAAPAPLLL